MAKRKVKKKVKRSGGVILRIPRSTKRSASIDNHGSKTGSGPIHYTVTLKKGGLPILKIQAVGADQYRRALVATDLWTRGATLAQVEKSAGKHINAS